MCPMNQYTRTYIAQQKQLRHVAVVPKLAALSPCTLRYLANYYYCCYIVVILQNVITIIYLNYIHKQFATVFVQCLLRQFVITMSVMSTEQNCFYQHPCVCQASATLSHPAQHVLETGNNLVTTANREVRNCTHTQLVILAVIFFAYFVLN